MTQSRDMAVVPVEPTEAMHRAAWRACDNGMKRPKDWAVFNRKIWAAMLAAAPQALANRDAPGSGLGSSLRDTHRAAEGAVGGRSDRFAECYENGAHPNCRRCYRGEVPNMADDSGFWVEMGAVAGGANEHGLNGWIELIEHHPDGREVRREYVATDSPAINTTAGEAE